MKLRWVKTIHDDGTITHDAHRLDLDGNERDYQIYEYIDKDDDCPVVTLCLWLDGKHRVADQVFADLDDAEATVAEWDGMDIVEGSRGWEYDGWELVAR
jgi:hypothetical protein